MLRAAGRYVQARTLVPPVSMEELRGISREFLEAEGLDSAYVNYAAILLNNELWKESLAAIPFERRLLLLPKCLRVEETCPATFDEIGMLCKKCGSCPIHEIQTAAEKLGYAVLVAEGSPIVMAIIETGKIDAIIGVSCMNVLERAFPHMEAAAIPGVAIPLLQDDCRETAVDEDWIWEMIHLSSDDRTRRLDLEDFRHRVETWFRPEALSEILGEPESETERIGHEWMARAGKRWRPFLTVAVHQALQEDPSSEIPADLRKIAVAVECFHKASLVHDDIEDEDEMRYGEETLHRRHGVPVALNAGDFLLGEGYRLLSESSAPAEIRSEMIRVAARGHRLLSLGQGAELCWAARPRPLSSRNVLDIFRQKTSPAFEVALSLGVLYASRKEGLRGRAETIRSLVERYSQALGVAYQIRDDLGDLSDCQDPSDLIALRPTLPLAIGHERARPGTEEKEILASVWNRRMPEGVTVARLRKMLERLGAVKRSRELMEAYKKEAVRALWDVESPNLKGLLRRVIGKVFGDAQIQGWCDEFEARNAAGREAGSPPAA
ncbi:MAG: DUF116 domain-containing protein [Planctomycetes bacterium]|nr:DUF116 domain-containing protein [Planctomycetota bacterium]